MYYFACRDFQHPSLPFPPSITATCQHTAIAAPSHAVFNRWKHILLLTAKAEGQAGTLTKVKLDDTTYRIKNQAAELMLETNMFMCFFWGTSGINTSSIKDTQCTAARATHTYCHLLEWLQWDQKGPGMWSPEVQDTAAPQLQEAHGETWGGEEKDSGLIRRMHLKIQNQKSNNDAIPHAAELRVALHGTPQAQTAPPAALWGYTTRGWTALDIWGACMLAGVCWVRRTRWSLLHTCCLGKLQFHYMVYSTLLSLLPGTDTSKVTHSSWCNKAR